MDKLKNKIKEIIKDKKKIGKIFLIFVSALIFAIDIYVARSVQIFSFEQVLFSLLKIEGGSASPIISSILPVAVVFLLLFILFLLPIINFGKKVKIAIKGRNVQIYPIKKVYTYGISLIVLSLVLLLYILKFFPYVTNTVFSSTDLFDKYYTDTSSVKITFPEKKRNLIYIFMESSETSNVSKENGGLFDESIIPNLEELAVDNINFSNTELLGGPVLSYGSNWTAAAMIAHTSGIPFKIKFSDIDINSTSLLNVKTLGDILSENGYNSYLLLGSDASFGGRLAYFSNHNYLISDYYTAINEGKISKDYYEWWGYEDAKLFEYAKEMLEKISKDNKPFNLTLLTSNTHFTDGYLEKDCEKKFDSHYANSFYCSDKMISEFIDYVKEQDYYDNTTIIVVGDHHTMQDNFYKDNSYVRTIYNVFINAKPLGKVNNKNRIFTTFDMFPTTLGALGASIEGDRLGLGTNLFSEQKTLPEIMGIKEFNNEIMKGSSYYDNVIRK